MLFKTLIALLLTSAAIPSVALAGDACPFPPRECEAQIRQILGGRRYLGGLSYEKTRYGIIVRSVAEGSPAKAAGFLRDDLIISVNGRNARRVEIKELKEMFRQTTDREGKLTFVVTRYGQIRRLHARLATMPKAAIDGIVEAHLREGHGEAPAAPKQ